MAYKFRNLKAVKAVMAERRGPDNRYVKGWGHHRTAPVICELIAKHNLSSFVEVGSCGCQLSEIVLIEFPNIKVWSVDRHFKNIRNNAGMLTDAPIERMAEQFKGRYEAIERHSPQASELFDDKSLDIVYIDAFHQYDGVRKDIYAWWPKVSDRGLLSGHDYGHQPNPGVAKAVDEVFNKVNVGDYYNWWVIKSKANTRIQLPARSEADFSHVPS